MKQTLLSLTHEFTSHDRDLKTMLEQEEITKFHVTQVMVAKQPESCHNNVHVSLDPNYQSLFTSCRYSLVQASHVLHFIVLTIIHNT